MLAQTFFVPVPAIQQYKNLHQEQKEIYSTKTENVFLSFFKN